MDDFRFDRLVRSFASGSSRRQVLKGILGLGGGLVAGSTIGEANAARRPTPTPKPVSCPGNQVWSGDACTCVSGDTCGPDCCPAEAQCCDNACCYGTCYGEEWCCPAPRAWCDVSGECCPDGWRCCPERGCISPDQCCTSDDCPDDGCAIGRCSSDRACEYSFDCTAHDDCCVVDACYRSDCDSQTGSCGEPVLDCTMGEGCCDDGDVCTIDSCNVDTGICEPPTAISCGCVSDGSGGTVSCGECDAAAPCCTNGTCGVCPVCRICEYGQTQITLADGSTRGHQGGQSCISPCTSNADCACGQLCVATYQLCLDGTPSVDCTDTGRPAGAYCGNFNLCSIVE